MTTREPIFRRGPAGENDIVTQIVYTPTENEYQQEGFERTVEKIKLFRRSKEAQAAIQQRKKWTRFGAAAGATGMERGVSMVAMDQVLIEDPLSEEANKTGEERLIERLKATVKSKGTHRDQDNVGDDYQTYVSNLQQGQSHNRPQSNNNKYRQSPSKYRASGPSPGKNYRNSNSTTGNSSGRVSPAFTMRNAANSSNNRGTKSPARTGQNNTNNRNSASKSPAAWTRNNPPSAPRQQPPQ